MPHHDSCLMLAPVLLLHLCHEGSLLFVVRFEAGRALALQGGQVRALQVQATPSISF